MVKRRSRGPAVSIFRERSQRRSRPRSDHQYGLPFATGATGRQGSSRVTFPWGGVRHDVIPNTGYKWWCRRRSVHAEGSPMVKSGPTRPGRQRGQTASSSPRRSGACWRAAAVERLAARKLDETGAGLLREARAGSPFLGAISAQVRATLAVICLECAHHRSRRLPKLRGGDR